MNAYRIISAALIALLCGANAALADLPTYAYVTTGPGKQVLRVNNATHATAAIFTANAASTAALSDVTLGADGLLYVSADATVPASSSIAQVNPATNGFTFPYTAANAPRELRFSAYGALFCNGGGGVSRLASLAAGCTEPVGAGASGTTGTGLAFTANGSLLALIDGKIMKVTLNIFGQSTGSVQVASGLSGITSIAVAAGGEGTPTGFASDDFLVAIGNQILKFARDKTQASGYQATSTPVVTMAGGRTVNHIELDAEDRVWFTTLLVNGPSNSPNGELWVYAGGSPVLMASAPKQNGKYWPLVGLAIDPSDRTISISAADPLADFGSSWFELVGTINPACTVAVRATTKSADLPAIASNFKVDPYLGDEGFSTVYDAKASPADCDVFPINDGRVFISARASSETSPRILRCETISGCVAVQLVAVFHTGPLDNDMSGGGEGDNFSRWLLVNETVSPASFTFCGIQSPLKGGGDADHPQSSAKTGSNVAVKFQVGHPNCQPGQYLTDPNAQFLISVARVRPDYERKHVPDASGNSNEPPQFRYTSTTQSYIYDLSLKNLDGTNFEPGTYEITITDVNSPALISTPAPIYFSVTASGNK